MYIEKHYSTCLVTRTQMDHTNHKTCVNLYVCIHTVLKGHNSANYSSCIREREKSFNQTCLESISTREHTYSCFSHVFPQLAFHTCASATIFPAAEISYRFQFRIL